MQRYKDIDNDSGVSGYELGSDYIIVKFDSGNYRFYKYNYNSTGCRNIERMKKLAKKGEGLNEFIVENNISYSHKWR